MTSAIFWTTALGLAITFRATWKLASLIFNRSGRTPKLPLPLTTVEEQYQHDVEVEQAQLLATWDSEFQSATGKRVDWLLDPSLEEVERRKLESWRDSWPVTIMNQQQQPVLTFQALQNQQLSHAQQQLAAQGQLGMLGSTGDIRGQFGSSQPLDMSPFLAAMGIIQPKKPS